MEWKLSTEIGEKEDMESRTTIITSLPPAKEEMR